MFCFYKTKFVIFEENLIQEFGNFYPILKIPFIYQVEIILFVTWKTYDSNNNDDDNNNDNNNNNNNKNNVQNSDGNQLVRW